MARIKFGLGIPTGTEGLMYPIPYATAQDVVELSVYAEKMGFDSVWGNDHISTQHYVRAEYKTPPRYYAPLLVLSAISQRTTTLKVATALLVIPFRHPVIMAKEIATLDHLSGGRLLLGVGLGAYREEFEAEFGRTAKEVVRGKLFDESIELLYRIFTEDVVSHEGEYFSLNEVHSYPKPVQKPFPFYFGGNNPKGYERTARYGNWLPALLTPAEVKVGCERIKEFCGQYNRDFSTVDIAPQIAVAVAKTREEAAKRFEASQMYKHTCSLKKSTMKNQDPTQYFDRNLIGSVDDVCEQIERYIEAGVTTLSALIFANNSIEETREEMQFFSEEIIAKFR